jgi:hypothetical protein
MQSEVAVATATSSLLVSWLTCVLQAAGGGHGKELELLKGITGAFRPGILTALMGGSQCTAPDLIVTCPATFL